MCGIVGISGKENASGLVIKGMKIINYRGIDGYGIYYNNKCLYSDSISFNVDKTDLAIGHCLHAVVNKVKQPFKDKGVLAVNCEIYNWKELAEKYNIKAENDAELFFKLLEKFGVEKTLELIDGDYAGCYFLENKIYLFRDRIGVKPIWYSLNDSFAFSSERKVLRELGYENVAELNPRKILIYDIKTKKIKFIDIKFYNIAKVKGSYDNIKKKLGGYLTNAVAKRVPDAKFGLLFSGALDSGLIALILKKLNLDFTCYTCVFKDENMKTAEDLEYAKLLADKLDLNLKVIEVSISEVEKALPIVSKLIESNDVTKISVSLAFYFACKKAREDGIKVIFSGLGSDDLFAGYSRHLKSPDINKECCNSMLNLYEKDLYRDDVITMYNNLELRVPFLDSELISFGLGINSKYKINEKGNKIVLRDAAYDYGLAEFSHRKKLAVQYGSNFLKAVEKLSKKNNYKSKSEYLKQFYNEGNVKLAALFSSGKDSCYAMYIMKKQNYDIKCLVTIKSRNKDSFMYHTPNIDMAKLQAEAMSMPLILQETSGEKEKELDDLEIALKKAKLEYGIEGVVVGALYSTYQRDRVQKIAEKLGLKVFAPLWHKNQEKHLRELLENKFEFIISSIASDGLDESWLGKKITEKEVDELIKLSKKFGINPAGEGGETESLVLDCPMFKKRLVVEGDKIMENKNVGLFKIKKAKLVIKL